MRSRGPIVIDTDVFSADLVRKAELAELYAPLIARRPVLISFQTVDELHYGALRRGWGEDRVRRLEDKIQRAEVVHSQAGLVTVSATLRASCAAQGHPLAQSLHTADRWIAATALWLGVPLVSNDRIFRNVPGLELQSVVR